MDAHLCLFQLFKSQIRDSYNQSLTYLSYKQTSATAHTIINDAVLLNVVIENEWIVLNECKETIVIGV